MLARDPPPALRSSIRGLMRAIAILCVTALGYYAAARLGYAYAISGGFLILWPPSGLMLAILLRLRPRDWALAVVGCFVGNLAADLGNGNHLSLALTLAGPAVNALEIVTAASVLRVVAGSDLTGLTLTKLRHVGALVLGAAVVSNAVTALAGAWALPHVHGDYWWSWFVWWAGDGMGMLIVAPVILSWVAFAGSWRDALDARRGRLVEGIALALAVAVLGQLVLGQGVDAGRAATFDPYVLLPLLLWAAVRFGQVGATTTMVAVTALTLWNTTHGVGPFAALGRSPRGEALAIYVFLALGSLTSMTVAALLRERQVAEADASERARQAAFVAEVAVTLTEGAALAEMLTRSADAIVRQVHAVGAGIWTISEDATAFELRASSGSASTVWRAQARVSVSGDSPIATIARTRRPLVIADTALVPSDAAVEADDRAVRVAGYPLVLAGEAIGVIGIAALAPLSARTEESLVSIARALALGIRRTALEVSRQRLADILEAATDFVTIGQTSGPPLFVNAAARRALEIGQTERIASIFALRPEGFATTFRDTILPALERDGIWAGETEYASKSGRLIPVSQVSVAHRDASGALSYLSTISRDITQERQAEAALRDSEERIRFALHSARVGLWETDLKTGDAFWSDTCEALHGLAPGTFGRTFQAFLDCVDSDDRAGVAEAIERAGRDGTEAEVEYHTRWPDGTVRLIHSTSRFFYDEHGTPERGAGVARDITDRRALEEELRQAQKMEGIGQLAGGIAHDFNNLLTAILGYAELLAGSLPASDIRRRDVEEIAKAGTRAAALTRQLLAFSRKQILAPRVVQLCTVVGDVIPMLRQLLGESVDLRTVFHDSGLVKVDAGQLGQVLVNLAVNARDAMPGGGRLTIETAEVVVDTSDSAPHPGVPAGRYVSLAMSDTGHGMDDAIKRRIFDPFFTTKPLGQGTGLGLSTVHGIVKQSGGHVWVSSEVGRGTTFTVLLPMAADAEDLDPLPDLTPTMPSRSGTVLVVEDEPLIRAFVEKVLTTHGYAVYAFAAPSGALAFADSYRQTIHVVLTDVILPEMNGRALAQRLIEAHPEASVVYMSGYTDTAIVHRGVLDAGTRFLQKPFSARSLLERIGEVSPAGPTLAVDETVTENASTR
jgi:PAS domain S-box-containing protein